LRIRTRSFIIAVTQGLTQASTVILGIVLAHWLLSQRLFGTYRQVFLVYSFLTGIFSFQLSSSLYYFLPKLGTQMRKTLLGQTLAGGMVLSLAIATIMFFGADVIGRIFNNADLVPLVKILSFYSLADGILQLIPPFMISLDRAIRAGVYSVLSAFGRMIFTIAAFAAGFNLSAVMWITVVVSVIMAIAGCIDMAMLSPGGTWKLDRKLISEQIHYTWPLWAGSIAIIINSQLDKLLISTFFDPLTYAVYYCGAMELPVVALITQSINTAIMPNLVSLVAQHKADQALFIWQEAMRKCSFIMFPCFALFMVIGGDFMVLLYGKNYEMATWPFRVYLLGLPLRVAFYSTILRAFGRTKPIAISVIFSLMINAVVSISLLLIGRGTLLAFIGPSISTVVAAFVSGGYLLWRTSRVTATPLSKIIRWKELIAALAVSIGAGVAIGLIPMSMMPIILRISVKTLVFLVLFGIITRLTLLNNDELSLLKASFAFVNRIHRKLYNR